MDLLILESIPERPEAPGIPSKEIDTAAVILGSSLYHEDTDAGRYDTAVLQPISVRGLCSEQCAGTRPKIPRATQPVTLGGNSTH